MDEKSAQDLAHRYHNGDSQAFDILFNKTVGMVKVNKYYDPTGARTKEDFIQATRIGLYKALGTWEKDKGSTLISWIRNQMTQYLIREIKSIQRSSHTKMGTPMSIDGPSTFDGEETKYTIEEVYYQEFLDSGIYQQEFDQDLYTKICVEVQERIKNRRRVNRVFELKMAFPEMTRSTISKITGYSKPSISIYFDIINKAIREVSKKYSPYYDNL